jgi:hypothetical protein
MKRVCGLFVFSNRENTQNDIIKIADTPDGTESNEFQVELNMSYNE